MMSHKKMTISGNNIQILSTELPFNYGYKESIKRVRIPKPVDPKKTQENRMRTIRRTKARIKTLIQTNHFKYFNELGRNYYPIFLTLTPRELITDLDYFNREFSKFIQRLNYKINTKEKHTLKYLGVIEFQKRGAIHYHILFFNLPFIKNVYDEVKSIWSFGSANIKTIKDMEMVIPYMIKYMTKDNQSEKLSRRKSYFTSKGLAKPVEIMDEDVVNEIINSLSDNHKVFDKVYDHQYYKKTKFELHKLPYDHHLLQKIHGIRG